MQRQHGELVPIGDALSGMDGPVKAIRFAMRHIPLSPIPLAVCTRTQLAQKLARLVRERLERSLERNPGRDGPDWGWSR